MKNEGQTTATASNPWWNGAYILVTDVSNEDPQDVTALIFKVIGSSDGFLFGVVALNESRTLENQPVVPFEVKSLKFITGKKGGGKLLFTDFDSAKAFADQNGLDAKVLEPRAAREPKKAPKKTPKTTTPTYRQQKQAA